MKNNFVRFLLGFIVGLLLLIGCKTSQSRLTQVSENKQQNLDIKEMPTLPTAEKTEEGIIVHKVKLDKKDESSNVWIYLPEKTESKKLPVVLIAAAGSYLFNGVSLGQGDQPEHLPYVRKGYAVVAYETPGSLKEVDLEQVEDSRLLKAINDFKNSKAGLINEQNALNYALEKVPSLDSDRIYVAGHSSAATLSLLVAANDPRIKAAIAYAPATELEKNLSDVLDHFNNYVPGFKDFIKENSPKNNISKINIPVFIFQAEDDSVIPFEDTKIFVSELQKVNSNVTFITAKKGDHYDSMIQEGMPKGIDWLSKIAFASSSSTKK